MGREQDLLEAARSGNVSLIEKLLTPRKKMTVGSIPLSLGPFPSLRRMPNPNCHDQNGDTPLHLAALNGYIDIVKLLLQHEASTNVVDCKGCCPLHLAAWSGNADMCRVLLTHGPSTAKVNEQNQAGETALHCAAQYGHTEVVSVLLEHLADPSIRNNQGESPLDLASQYGRLDTVELLTRKYPAILNDDNETHSPLHLASRNGHRQVVKLLLDAGFNINKQTDAGTALHEAAVYGKQDVVCLLLKQGIDVNCTDSIKRTALEALSEHKSQISLDIGKIILDYIEGRSISDKRSSTQSTSSDLLGEPLYDFPPTIKRHLSDAESYADRRPVSGRSSTDSSVFGATGGTGRLSAGSENFFLYDVPRSRPLPVGLEEADSASDTSDTTHSLPGAPCLSHSPGLHTSQHNTGGVTIVHGSSLPATPETPKKPPRRKVPSSAAKSSSVSASPPRMVFINKRSSTGSRDSASDSDRLTAEQNRNMKEPNGNSENNNALMTARGIACDNSSADNGKQRGAEKCSADVANSNHQEPTVITSDADILCQKHQTTLENNNLIVDPGSNKGQTVDNQDYLEKPAESSTIQYRNKGRKQPQTDGARDLDMVRGPGTTGDKDGKARSSKSGSPPVTPTSRPPSLDFSSKRSSTEVIPLSPTGYKQPPTPDHPPPSPMTAVLGIHEKINPKAKRRSRDMETITEAEFLSAATDGATAVRSGSHSKGGSTEFIEHHSPGGASLLRKKNQPDSGDVVIFANGSDPFHGLTKGAIPKGQRRVKSQVFDSFSHLQRSRRRISAPGICVNFDPLMEGEESQARDMMGSTGGIRMSARRSYMEGDGEDGSIDENEEWAKIAAILSSCGGRMSATEYCDYDDFERRLQKIFAEEKRGRPIQSVGDWLEELGLPQYENTLVANGFDDTDFLGPNILEDSDLLEMGITNEQHREIILKASSQIAPLQSIVEGVTPASVSKWLESLRLCDYLETFLANNFTTMDRVRNIWELELNSVLDITTLGHRKRILASLRVPPEVDCVSQSEDFMDFTKEWREMSADQTDELANLNLFKDYTNVRPLSQHRQDDDEDDELCELCQQQLNGIQLDESSQVQIRPPSTSSAESVGVKQWRHQPEVLIKGCCNYTVQYLGSTLVKSLQGTESTRESIHKMKLRYWRKIQKSSDSIAKVPSVVLSVSYRGVKFIDARSKHVICEHDISNIFCACQDGENLNYFAYITRDHVTECHYCHVFCVRSTELATEIILTLGEAFEVAYQVAIRERALDSANTHQAAAPSERSAEYCKDEVAGATAAATAAAAAATTTTTTTATATASDS